MKTTTVTELHDALESDARLDIIDVRTPAEYASVHVPAARSIPLDDLDCAAYLASRDGSRPIHILCHSGARATQAAKKFARVGFENAVVVEGGTQAWIDAGLPVERGERAVLPLDRQLQIVVGSIVIIGVLLSYFANPAWIGLPAFIGCGLVFAGLTGICPIRSLIATMPWNRGQCSGGNCCAG